MNNHQTLKSINYTLAYLRKTIPVLEDDISKMDDSNLSKQHLESVLEEQKTDLIEFEKLADEYM